MFVVVFPPWLWKQGSQAADGGPVPLNQSSQSGTVKTPHTLLAVTGDLSGGLWAGPGAHWVSGCSLLSGRAEIPKDSDVPLVTSDMKLLWSDDDDDVTVTKTVTIIIMILVLHKLFGPLILKFRNSGDCCCTVWASCSLTDGGKRFIAPLSACCSRWVLPAQCFRRRALTDSLPPWTTWLQLLPGSRGPTAGTSHIRLSASASACAVRFWVGLKVHLNVRLIHD